jgi:hypothetical protein
MSCRVLARDEEAMLNFLAGKRCGSTQRCLIGEYPASLEKWHGA